jgi:Mg2+-importing ATPase
VIVLVVRTRRPFFKSPPGKYLLTATLLIVGVTIAIPYTPLAGPLGFGPLPASFLLIVGVIVAFYIGAAELVKSLFYKRVKF